jgi:hypothetical protein
MQILKALSGIQAPTRQAPTSQAGGSATQTQGRANLEALHRPRVGIDSFDLGA